MVKDERGTMDTKVTEERDVVLIRWNANNLVNVASTQVGVREIEIECPQAILEYNRYTGGVDKLDFIMSLYPIRARTKKWP
ncbi:hypothetical protein HPB47_007802, partial [Ixodes persulcatus]